MSNIEDVYKSLENSNILIWGFGREGKSTLAFLRKVFPNKKIWIADKNEIFIADENVVTFLLTEWKEEYNKFDFIFKAPGIAVCGLPIDITKLTSQTEIFFGLFKKQIIGVTGTKGKSTVSSLLYHILKAHSDNTIFVGNIGIPCLDLVDSINENTVIVFELSCHQLEFVTCSPHISVILNLFEEHLDHYGNFDNYILAKKNIVKFQSDDDVSIINFDDVNTLDLHKKCITASMTNKAEDKANIEIRNEEIFINNEKVDISIDDTRLVGIHNLYNIAVAYYICCVLKNVPSKFFKERLKSFNGLAHRLQYVGTYDDIIYYNDSISTVCSAAIQGIEALKNVDTILIGGMDRKIDYNPLVDYLLSSTVSNVILMGETTKRLLDLFKSKPLCNSCNKNIVPAETLEKAVFIAKEVTKKNAICLLSPAASSYDQFKNFEERGNMFEKYVRDMKI